MAAEDMPEEPSADGQKPKKKRGLEVAGKYSLRKLRKKEDGSVRSVSGPVPRSKGELIVELKQCRRSRRSLD